MFPHFLVAIADLTHPLSNNRSSVRIIGCYLLGIYFYLFIYLVWEKKYLRYRDSNSRPNASEGYEPNELPGKKKERKITTEKKKRKKEKHLTVVDPETLFICVLCVFFPFILDIKFVGHTSRSQTGFLIHLLSAVYAFILLARRIQPFLYLVDREVEFCVLTI